FAGDNIQPVEADTTSNRVAFIGNLVQVTQTSGIDFNAIGGLVEGNLFSGAHASPPNRHLDMTFTTGVVITRNVFENLQNINGNDPLIWGPVRVINNTFDFCKGTVSWPLIGGGAVVQDNLFTQVDWAVGTTQPAGGGYNIFDPS